MFRYKAQCNQITSTTDSAKRLIWQLYQHCSCKRATYGRSKGLFEKFKDIVFAQDSMFEMLLILQATIFQCGLYKTNIREDWKTGAQVQVG